MARSALGFLALCLLGASALPSGSRLRRNGHAATADWVGWDNIRYAFIFGDSYTQTGFNYTLTAPSPANPLGNPEYPGYTASNGPNWVDFLTVEYNASLLQTYNFAYGGATVDGDIVAPYMPTVLSAKQQVETEFLPGYSGQSPSAPSPPTWGGDDSIFVLWFGINDIGNSYNLGTKPDLLNDKIMGVYSTLADELYDAGARNFVFINVPPVDRSPLTVDQGGNSVANEKYDINSWNVRLEEMAASLKANHTDEVNVWTFDSHKIFGEVLDDPASYPQTSGLRNTTTWCVDYEDGTDEEDTFVPSCGVPVNQYFWLNNLHPTYPMHAVVASELSAALAAGPNVRGNSTMQVRETSRYKA